MSAAALSAAGQRLTLTRSRLGCAQGLWGDQHSNNNGGNLYFEGKKFTIPDSVIKKLKKATKMEYKIFGKYL